MQNLSRRSMLRGAGALMALPFMESLAAQAARAAGASSTAAVSAAAPVPHAANPRLVFERMFNGRKPVVPNWNNRAAALQTEVASSAKSTSADQSVIDLVYAEAKDLNKRLATDDRHKLDEYLTRV